MSKTKLFYKSPDGVNLFGIELSVKKEVLGDNICPLCKGTFEDKEGIILLMNNFDAFPNKVIHQRCADTYAPNGDYEIIFHELRESYEKYKNDINRKIWE